MRGALAKAAEIEHKLDNMLKMSYINLQPYSKHVEWPVGQTRNIAGALSTKIEADDDHMIFKVSIPMGTSFQIHHHDMIENCIVVRGIMLDELQKGKQFVPGDVVTYSIGTPHMPRNGGSGLLVLQVVFHNPNTTKKQ